MYKRQEQPELERPEKSKSVPKDNSVTLEDVRFGYHDKEILHGVTCLLYTSHEERYRALLHNVEAQEVFKKSEVKVWECRNCGHIVVGTKAPEVCTVCAHPQSYFELHAENY